MQIWKWDTGDHVTGYIIVIRGRGLVIIGGSNEFSGGKIMSVGSISYATCCLVGFQAHIEKLCIGVYCVN